MPTNPNYWPWDRRYGSPGGNTILPGTKRRRSNKKMYIKKQGLLAPIEKKFLDSSLTNSALTAPGDASGGEHDPTALCLNAIPRSDDASGRDGRKAILKSVNVSGFIRCLVEANLTATNDATLCMVALVLDKQTNGAQLNSEDVFVNDSASSALACNVFRDMFNVQRFEVLDKVYISFDTPNMSWDGTNIEQGGSIKTFSFNKKLDIPVFYTSTATTVSAISDNSLHIIAYTNNTNLNPQLSYQCRVRFTSG